MGRFNELSQNPSNRVLHNRVRLSEASNGSHNIYSITPASGGCGAVRPGISKRSRSQTIALNVVGKPNKMRIYKNRIKSITKENGQTLLRLINGKDEYLLRDSVKEVEAKVEWANGY